MFMFHKKEYLLFINVFIIVFNVEVVYSLNPNVY